MNLMGQLCGESRLAISQQYCRCQTASTTAQNSKRVCCARLLCSTRALSTMVERWKSFLDRFRWFFDNKTEFQMRFLHPLRTLKGLKVIDSKNLSDFSYYVSVRTFQWLRKWGCQGRKCTPIFGGQHDKIHLKFCFFSLPISVVYPLISALRASPAFRVRGSSPT